MNTELREIDTEHFSVKYPESLEQVSAKNTELVLAFREDDGQFTPNIVFAVEANTAPLSDAAMRVMRLTPEFHPGARIVGVDLWGEELEGREITMLYPTVEATDVCVREWVWATGSHHLYATASYLPFQAHWAEATLEWVIQQLSFIVPPQKQTLAHQVEFPIDEQLMLEVGEPLETLAFLTEPPTLTGMPIALEAVDLLKRSVTQSRFGKRAPGIPRDERGGELALELERLGLAQGDGLGPLGESVGQTLAQGTLLANVWMRREGRLETLTATARGAEVVIVRTGGMGAPFASGRAQLVVCGIEQLLRNVLEWIALPPKFVHGSEMSVGVDEAEQRCALPAADGGWRKVTVEIPDTSLFSVLETDTGEAFLSEGLDDTTNQIRLSPLVATQLFTALREAIWQRMTRA